MKKQMFAVVVLISMAALLTLFHLSSMAAPSIAGSAPSVWLQSAPMVAQVSPSTAPNDLDAPILITGTNFISTPAVYLGTAPLDGVNWLSATLLEAVVPWGLNPGVYTLTVENPGGESGSLPNAFTVTQGIGEWNATALYGGQVRQVVLNPITPTTLYAVSNQVGLFRSRDSGANWSYVLAGGAEGLAVDPLEPRRLYLGGGMQRSDDEGVTWTPLGLLEWHTLYPHPTIPGTVYAARDEDPGGGVWKSDDYGQTWVTMTTGLTDTQVSALVFDPTNPMTMYVGTWNGNLFVSTNGGASWAFLSQPLDSIMTLAINPRGAHELWVSNCCFCTPNRVLKSTDLGHTTWAAVADPVGSASLPTIAFAPLPWGGDVYSGTVFVSACFRQVYKTADGGATWTSLDPDPAGGDAHWGLALHPTDTNLLYASSEWNGVYRTMNGGANWEVVNQGLTAVVPDQLITAPDQPDTVYAVTSRPEGVYQAAGGGETWQFLDVGPLTGKGRSVQGFAVDPFTPARLYAATDWPGGNAWWFLSGNDAGQTWPISVIITATEPYSDYNAVGGSILRADPSQSGTLLAGVNHIRFGQPFLFAGTIYRSTNYGLDWARMTMEGSPGMDHHIVDLAYDGLTPTIVYAATDGSGLFRSTDGGQTWQRSGASMAGLDNVRSIAVEPTSPYRVFAAGMDDLYVSEDHGLTWIQRNAEWWSGDIRRILCTHDVPSVLYFAAGGGLHRSTDGGQSWWQRAAGMLGHVPIYSLAETTAAGRVILYAGTTGGYAPSSAAQTLDRATNDDTIVNAGVYRYTTRRTQRVYLPLVLRAHTP